MGIPLDIKKSLVSRWKKNGGKILCIDWQQMEIRGGAALANVEVMLKELKAGQDIHKNNASALFTTPVKDITSKQRTYAKQRSFELQYGASWRGMVRNTAGTSGMSSAKQFIALYNSKYPEFNKRKDHIKSVARVETRPGSTPKYKFKNIVAKYRTPSGRILTFPYFENDPPPWNKTATHSISRTHLANWEAQSFTTADMSHVMIAKLLDRLLYLSMHPDDGEGEGLAWEINKDFFPILTQYDSLYFDCSTTLCAEELGVFCKKFLDNTRTIIENEFNIKDLRVDFPVDYTIKDHL